MSPYTIWLGKLSSIITSSEILAIGIGSEGILKKEDDDFAWDQVCIKIKGAGSSFESTVKLRCNLER